MASHESPEIASYTRRALATALVVGVLAGGGGGILAGMLVSQGKLSLKIPQSESTGTLQQTQYSDEETATIDVVAKANPAVVSVVISKEQGNVPQGVEFFPFDDFFSPGFPFRIQVPEQSKPKDKDDQKSALQRIGGGSGFIIESDGLIVTNKHVVDDEEAVYTIVLSGGEEYEAQVIAKDPILDIGLLKIEAKNLPTLPLGDSDSIALGQSVIAIGNALAELGNTVTRGVVSGINRRVEAGDGRGQTEVLEEAIQTDAAINQGNSGGPLLNLAGQVIGINTAVSSRGQLIGFAIPINSVKQTINSVREYGKIIRPWLGVRYQPVTPRLSELNNLSVTYGALVVRGNSPEELAVIPGSPADKAGLVENDIILEINGHRLEDKDSLGKLIATFAVGETIPLKILRKGNEKIVEVTLAEFPVDD